jgi:hypothetical protein
VCFDAYGFATLDVPEKAIKEFQAIGWFVKVIEDAPPTPPIQDLSPELAERLQDSPVIGSLDEEQTASLLAASETLQDAQEGPEGGEGDSNDEERPAEAAEAISVAPAEAEPAPPAPIVVEAKPNLRPQLSKQGKKSKKGRR